MNESKSDFSFEVGVSRHAPKVDVGSDVGSQRVDRSSPETLLGARIRAEELVHGLDHAPEGTILAFEPSNVARTGETRDIVVEEIRRLLDGRTDIEIVEIGDDRNAAEALLQRIQNDRARKYIITDIRPTHLLGFREEKQSTQALKQWKEKLGTNEHLIGKVWASRKGEEDALAREMQEEGFSISAADIQPRQFRETPESAALRQIRWMTAMKKIGESRFPGRPLRLEGISHNLRSDFTALALLGEPISKESIDRVLGGKFRAPFERSSVVFQSDGTVRVSYRDHEAEHTSSSFQALRKEIEEASKARRKEWEE